MPRLLLSEEHWSKLREILLHKAIYNKRDLRMTVEGMLYRMRTECPWRDLPKAFGYWNKVYKRFNAGRSGTRGFTERIAWHVVLLCSNGRRSYRAPGRQLVRKISLPPPCRCGRVLSCGRSTRSSASPQVPEPPSPAPRCRERSECP